MRRRDRWRRIRGMSIPAEKRLSPEAEEVLQRACKLPEPERLRLADALVESVASARHQDLSPAWHEEIARRADAFERGELQTVDGPEVFARIEAKYAR